MPTSESLCLRVSRGSRGSEHLASPGPVRPSRMKLKEFMANTLPRSKKSKRKSHQSSPASSSSSSGSSGQLSARDCINAVTCNKSLVTDDFRYLKDASTSTTPPPPQQRMPFSVNLNLQLQTTGDPCGCYPTSRGAYVSDDYSLSDTEYRAFSDGSEGNYNTIPKARSRIRTNPWLPSPKTSPPLSPPSTPVTSPSSPMTSSSSTSPLHAPLSPPLLSPESDSACMDSSFSASSDFSSSAENYYNIKPHRVTKEKKRKTKTSKFSKDSSADSLSDADSLLQRSYTSDMTDNSITANEHFIHSPGFDGTIKGEEVTINLREGVISIHATEMSSPVSFEYEEALESTLETPGVGKFVGSRDSLNWANRDSCHMEDVFSNMKRSNVLKESEEERLSSIISGDEAVTLGHSSAHRASSDDSGDSSGTLCCDIPTENHIAEATPDQGAEECMQTSYHIVDSEDKENIHLHEQESMDSGFSSAHFSDTTEVSAATSVNDHGGKRTVNEIRSSLQEKVLRLRQEKRLVDEKIREAREEERLRMQNIACFQQQVTALRKQVLLDTLDRLKQRLAEQGQRLQTCYDSVLNRQWSQAASKRQRTSLPGPIPHCLQKMDSV